MNTKKITSVLQIALIACICLISSLSIAQRGKISQANKEYRDFAYIRTSEILLDVVENGYKSPDILKKLGDSFYFNNQMEDAAKWYGELFELDGTESLDPEYYFRYAQALKSTENYTESNKWMEKFSTQNRGDLRAKSFLSTKDYLSSIEELSQNIELKNLDINSELSDFGTFIYGQGLYFASSRGNGRKYEWNEQPFSNLYIAKETDEGYGEATFFDDLNTRYHESSVAITPDGKTLYFTRSNFYKGKYRSSQEGTNHLKLFRASLKNDGKWGDIEPIRFNSNSYSIAHPTINASGTKLYFSSDMDDSFGESDLYVSDINPDGSLEDPVNLGKYVNTEARETFPFINPNGDLYYSSNGFNGLGGLDIFVIRDFENKLQNSQPLVLENLAKPFNSPMDDFAYFEDLDSKIGYLSSNRAGGKGYDDIYSFEIVECVQSITGVITDMDTNEILPGATVILLSEDNRPLRQVISAEDGSYRFSDLDCDTPYLVRASLEEYSTEEKRTVTNKTSEEDTVLDIALKRDQIELNPCDDLAKILDIPIIYFDFDKYNIRYDAEVELQKVLAVLKKYPSMSIDIRSHTDCRGTETYNETLSENRAQSTRQYFIDQGISADRLTAKGYGEYRLVNDCACEPTNNSDCSEAEHQLNRRSEFIVTSFRGQKCEE